MANFSPVGRTEILWQLHDKFQPGLKYKPGRQIILWNCARKVTEKSKWHQGHEWAQYFSRNLAFWWLSIFNLLGWWQPTGWWKWNETCLWSHTCQPERVTCIGREDIFKLVVFGERPGAGFSKVPIINGPGKLSPFTLKIEVSIVLHLAW